MAKLVRNILVSVFGFVFSGMLFVQPAQADDWNRKTVFTTSVPIQLPGHVVLPPGKYVMKLVDSRPDRTIVQVFSEDEVTVYSTSLGIPDTRPEAGKAEINFYENNQDRPAAMRSWFYAGSHDGVHFVYPKSEAALIAGGPKSSQA